MKIYLNSTANLGDFLNAMPVLSGIYKKEGNINLIIKHGLRKFLGIKEFLMFQEIFEEVCFDDEYFFYGSTPMVLSSWTREDKNDPNRPIETCRYENWFKDHYQFDFDVDDQFVLKVYDKNDFDPIDLEQVEKTRYCADRWVNNEIDARRETQTLQGLEGVKYLDYSKDLMYNAFLIRHSKPRFLTALTGTSVLGDLLYKEQYVIWKPEDWKPEFRRGNDINWDNGKGIKEIAEKHFYGNRFTELLRQDRMKDIEWN